MNHLQKDRGMTFDYIVVGTGPAGAVIAKTLTDNKRNSVLVLEAGENNDKDIMIKINQLGILHLLQNLKNIFFPNTFGKGKGYLKRNLMNVLLNGPRVDSWAADLRSTVSNTSDPHQQFLGSGKGSWVPSGHLNKPSIILKCWKVITERQIIPMFMDLMDD